ncbi:SWIM-type domain-containing protein [Citrus sinensis]|nr:SWIM-type domain-containing protein [Citrus sinensis]
MEQNRDNSRTQLNWERRETNQQGLRDYNKTDAKRKGFPDPVKLKRTNLLTHSRFASPNAAGAAGSCCSRYRKLLELLVRGSRPSLVAGSAVDRRLAAACAVGTAEISRLAVGTARVWLLELLAFGCWLCSRLAAGCARVWLLVVLAFGCWLCSLLVAGCARFWLLVVLAFSCWLCSRLVAGCARVWLLVVLAFGCWLCSCLAAACARMVDQPSQNLNAHSLYSFEQEDDEAYWSNDDNEDITPTDDEMGLNWDDEGVDVGHIEGCEEVDYGDSEEEDRILSNCESDDREHGLLSDSEDEQSFHCLESNPNEMIEISVGQEFDNVQHFRRVLESYVIKNGFDLNRIKNEKGRFRAKCSNEGCPWFIYAALVESGTKFRIQKLNNVHECNGVLENKEASYKWIASQFEGTLKNNPKMPVKAMKDELVSNLGVKASMKKMYRAKKRAMDKLNGNYANSYQRLRDYAQILKQSNPNTFVALKNGFINGCRWFIGLDGCHLKGYFGGVLLSAVTLDANNGIFPIAVCICESECADSWKWFLAILSEWLNIEDQSRVTFMTDRQKGILLGLEAYWHGAAVRHCARHIFANLRSNHPDIIYRNLFWTAARATTEKEWEDDMKKIKTAKKDTQAAYDYLIKIDKKQWARHAFPDDVKVDHVTNNLTESWNSWLNEYRDKPVLTLMEFIRKKVMKRLYKRHSDARKWIGKLPPTVRRKLNVSRQEGRYVRVLMASEYEFEVMDENNKTFMVNMQNKTCDCGVYQICGIPCKHIIPCIALRHEDAADYVDKKLTVEAYLATYANIIHPLPDQSTWAVVEGLKVLPPYVKARVGRPKIVRKREPGEEQGKRKTKQKCSSCAIFGHNKRSCKRPIDSTQHPSGTATQDMRGSSQASSCYTNL